MMSAGAATAATTTATSDAKPSLLLSDLLKEQYVLVERFANAQTMLFNAVITTESKTSLSQHSYHSSYRNDGGGGSDNPLSLSSLSSSSSTATTVADHDLQLCRAVKQLEQAKKDLRRNWKQLIERIDTITTTSDGTTATINTSSSPSSSKLPSLSSSHERNVYTEHLKISQRVICTLQQNPQWHSNGLPMINIPSSLHSSSSLQTIETTTIALATLKASIANVLLSSSSSSS